MGEVNNYDRITDEICRSRDVFASIAADSAIRTSIDRWSQTFAECLANGGQLFFAGNGGSFSDALHLAAEFTGKMGRRRPPLPAYALGSNGASVSAIGNDYEFADVFAREYRGLYRPGSALLVMSTSGNSGNILRLVETAKDQGGPVLAFTGGSGGRLKALCECVIVPSNQTERIQEAHILLGHVLCGLVETRLAGTCFEWE